MDEVDVRCLECRKWKQHYYWNHFEATKRSFFKVLIADFSRKLSIPRKFVLHFKDLPKDAKLKGPSGNLWNVKLKRSGDDVAFTGGWSKFAEDHLLELGDFLVFRYIGDSCFKVLVFDKTACEKEHSYFIGEKTAAEVGDACPSRGSKHKSVEPPLEDDQKCSDGESANAAAEHASDRNPIMSAGKECSFRRSLIRQQPRRRSCRRRTSESPAEHHIDNSNPQYDILIPATLDVLFLKCCR
ncbi:B3 domain-containing protein REM16-like [Musa acuminata AAA Group]|uniref:B3 domain-containing protein REM16-like n=1 Tax=Musa acuminata AAA Group TaxID=214697 RepID=UPI0031D93533